MQYTNKEVYEHISMQTRDPIVEWKTCTVSWTQFPIYQSDLDFYNNISPTFNGVRFQIPTPTLCPEERSRRRLAFVNNYSLYKRKCDCSGETVISCYSPDKQYKVYSRDLRWGDVRSGSDYAQNMDQKKGFENQFQSLFKMVPHIWLYGFNNENSPYNNGFINIKNCNMCFTVDDLENCSYCYSSTNLDWCYDCDLAHYSQKSYQILNCKNCFEVQFAVECEACTKCMFIERCIWCADCFMCTNLVNRQYCIENVQYEKDEYIIRKNKLLAEHTIESLFAQFRSLSQNSIWSSVISKNTELVFGSDTYDSSKSSFVYNVNNIEDCKYCWYLFGSHHCYDTDVFWWWSSFLYECVRTGGWEQNIMFSFGIFEWSYDIWYSALLIDCKYCFGCVGLKHKEYCIFNKQYEKDEYEEEVKKIIESMIQDGTRGEFFSPSLSPFGYNETLAQEHFPMEQKQAESLWFQWMTENYDPKITDQSKIVIVSDYSDSEWNEFSQTQDPLWKIFMCEISNRPFLLQKSEIAYYKTNNLPLPRKHPQVRHDLRVSQRPIRWLHLRDCALCNQDTISIYTEKDPTTVYCESCYKKYMHQ